MVVVGHDRLLHVVPLCDGLRAAVLLPLVAPFVRPVPSLVRVLQRRRGRVPRLVLVEGVLVGGPPLGVRAVLRRGSLEHVVLEGHGLREVLAPPRVAGFPVAPP